MREQEEKGDAERLLNQVSKDVRDGANAKQRAEIKRALSARARELEAAQKQAERFVTAAFYVFKLITSALFIVLCREQALREEEVAAARAIAAVHDRERVLFRVAEFQLKRARAAAAAQEEEEEQRRRGAALQALAGSVAPTVEADPRRVLQVFAMF